MQFSFLPCSEQLLQKCATLSLGIKQFCAINYCVLICKTNLGAGCRVWSHTLLAGTEAATATGFGKSGVGCPFTKCYEGRLKRVFVNSASNDTTAVLVQC